MRVFLIHGLGRTPLSMWLLKRRLESAGHQASLFGYLAATSELEHIAERFVVRARQVLSEDGAEGGEPYAIVGHSLGNVVARLASPRLPPGLCRFVMLAPPNRPPAIARALSENPVYRLLAGDAGRKLCDDDFFAELPAIDAPTLIVAGTRGPRSERLPFGGEPNDSILRLAETRLEEVPTLEVRAVHSFLMNRRDVFRAIRDFLENEVVLPASKPAPESLRERTESAP